MPAGTSPLDAAIASARTTIGKPQVDEVRHSKPTRSTLLDIVPEPRQQRTSLSASTPAAGWLAEESDGATDSVSFFSESTKRSMVRPIWREVLDENRGIARAEARSGHQLPSERATETWPPMLVPSTRLTLDLWEQVEENRQATTAMLSVVERPGQYLNPIHINGVEGIGKSHLVIACAQALQEQLGPASVRMARCALLANEQGLWPIPPQEIDGLRMLIIEDLDEIIDRMGRLQEMSSWLLWQISCGVQVVLTSDGSLQSNQSSGDLRRLLEASVGFHLPPYSNVSMMRMLRRRCNRREMMIPDPHLQALIESQGDSAPRLFAAFEKMCISETDGSLAADPAEAIKNLMGVGSAYQAIFADGDPVDTAREIAAQALEETESVDFVLDSPPLDIEAEWDPKALLEAEWDTSDLLDPEPSFSHARRMEEEDAALREAWREGFELPEPTPEAEEFLSELSTRGLDRMADVGMAFEGYNQLLEKVESEMRDIANELENADSETLLQLADKLVHLEGSLQSLRPSTSEFEPFRLTMSPEPEADLPDLDILKKLDEYTPEGEWDVDEDEVSTGDLFGMADLQPVAHKVLVPADSIPKGKVDIDGEQGVEVTPADPKRQRDDEGKLGFAMPDVMDRQVGVTRHKRKERAERDERDRKTAARAETWRASVEEKPRDEKPTDEDELVRKFVGKSALMDIRSEEEQVKSIEQKPDEEQLMDNVVKKIVRQPVGAPAAKPQQAALISAEDEQMDRVVKKIIRQPIHTDEKE